MQFPRFCRKIYDIHLRKLLVLSQVYTNKCVIVSIEKQLHIALPSPLQPLKAECFAKSSNRVWCKRDDLIHPIISGNKWRKLKPTLQSALTHNITHIGSFGGAYSNHLHALGYACSRLKVRFTAIVRAHPQSPMTPMLKDLQAWGTNIHFVSREHYKQRESLQYMNALQQELGLDILIPEGGSSNESLAGVAEIMLELSEQHPQAFDFIVLPVASGGTMAGLIQYIQTHNIACKVIGIAVLKGEGYLERSVNMLLGNAHSTKAQAQCWEILHHQDFHAGGYAKSSDAHKHFQSAFYSQQGYALDSVYNTKSFFALNQLLKQGVFGNNKSIAILNTGGLQGDREKPSN